MFVTLDRMHPGDDQLVYSQVRAEGDRYIYRIKQAGTQTIRLATVEAAAGSCAVTLQADYFDTQTVTIKQADVEVKFNRWEDTLNSSVTNTTSRLNLPLGTVVVGEKIRYYVDISTDKEPDSVTINGQSATRSGTFNGEGKSNTTWYIEYSNSNKGNYTMSVQVSFEEGGKTYTIDLGDEGKIKVAGLTRSNSGTTSPTSGTLYVWRNTNYQLTYLTAINEKLEADTSFNYYNLFTVDGSNMVSVARNKELKCTNSNNSDITFDASGTDYTFTQSNSDIRVSYVVRSGMWNTTYYLRQSNNTIVQNSTTNNQNTWTVYSVTCDIPED